MTAVNTIEFSGYTLRPAGEADRALAEQWTAADEEHAGKIDPGFWMEQRDGVDSTLVLDSQGPVFFFKVRLISCGQWEAKLRAHVFIQFMPCATDEDRERTREALTQGTAWLEPVLTAAGAEEYFFDTRNARLSMFCIKRLGFEVHPEPRMQGKAALSGGAGMVRLRKMLAKDGMAVKAV